MNAAKRCLALTALASSLLLSGCAGGAFTQPSSWPGLASDGRFAYLAMDQSVYAIDLGSGAPRWQYPAQPERNRTFYAAPAVSAEGQLFLGDFANQLTALRAEDGTEMWGPIPLSNDRSERVIGSPAIAGELVLVPSTDGRLYAHRVSDGSPVWSFPPASEQPLEEAIWAAPLVVDDRIYIAAMDHRVYAVDLNTGRALWSSAPDLGGAVADAPVLADDLLLVGSFAGQVVALDPASGRILWEYDASDWVWGSPAVNAQAVYFGDLAGQVYAVSIDGGAEIWSVSIGGPIAASPVINGDLIYLVSENGLLTVRNSANNNPAWQATIQGQLLTDPLLVDGTLLVASNGGEPLLSAFDAESGAQRWTFTP